MSQSVMKIGIITGITGQDGSYLAELLLSKGYRVYGIVRRTSSPNTSRIDHILSRVHLEYADMCDSGSIVSVFLRLKETYPDCEYEIYNLAAQSHVHTSFQQPEYTANVDALGTLRLLDAIRVSGIHARFYQASTSELFGKVHAVPQTESTPFYPRSPYGIAKLYAYWIVKNYRESYGMFACNGILFNHESERRGEEFITRKISLGVARSIREANYVVELGNLNAERDWGHAEEYVYGMWQILQQETPDDYILATGQTHSVREFAEKAFACAGVQIHWEGAGVDEKGYDAAGRLRVAINPAFYRPCEVDLLVGDASKAFRAFGWTPRITFEELVSRMVKHDEVDPKHTNPAQV